MDFWSYYFLIINFIGFAVFLVNVCFFGNHTSGKMSLFLGIISILGGSLGVVISIFCFDRKAVKSNMMFRVFIICLIIIQLIIMVMVNNGFGESIKFSIISFFENNEGLFNYLLVINMITFIAFGIDKFKAINGLWRIRIVTLLGLSFAGGSLGGLLSMYIFRHKTNVSYFKIGLPLIMVMQIIFIFYMMNI